jgi:hypothetical protein
VAAQPEKVDRDLARVLRNEDDQRDQKDRCRDRRGPQLSERATPNAPALIDADRLDWLRP